MSDQGADTRPPERTAHTKEVDRLQYTGLTGTVFAVENIHLVQHRQAHLLQVANLLNFKKF